MDQQLVSASQNGDVDEVRRLLTDPRGSEIIPDGFAHPTAG